MVSVSCLTVKINRKSKIRHENFRPSPPSRLYYPPLDSETGWTGELWSKTNPSIGKTKGIAYFFFGKTKIFSKFSD